MRTTLISNEFRYYSPPSTPSALAGFYRVWERAQKIANCESISMDIFQNLAMVAIILWVVLPCLTLLLLYSIIRIAVARGLRDHQKSMEKNRPLPD
ncbi:hypothetical protein [Rathayibacter soli]|uniref:hypothetical protein n=1 Tax=Rathayibacter soli TaxID=3144168 RepID=UPI0027E45737|nr:hypothetical protein [Glaciibacter superstes]